MQNQILIIGAGLSGLALAQGLVKAGFQPIVFERDETHLSRAQGYRISIRSLGMQALAAVLAPEKLEHLSLAKVNEVGDGFTCANEMMESLLKIPLGQDAAVQFLRTELRKLLQEGIDIRWNKRLTKFEDDGYQVVASFEDGSKVAGALLVGCDGGASTLRDLLPKVYGNRLGAIPKVVETKRFVLSGQIDRTPEWDNLLPLNQNGLVRYVGRGKHSLGICFSERTDRSKTVFWALSGELEDCNAPWHPYDQSLESRAKILQYCQDVMRNEPWHENLRKVVNDTLKEAILAPWRLRTTQFPDPGQFPIAPTGRVTLVGDSAHVMLPDRGLGGNNALEDARLLSALLASSQRPINWPKLIGAYETEMYARAKIAVQESENAVENFRQLRASR